MKRLNQKSFFLLLGAVVLLNTTTLPALAQIDFTVPLKEGRYVQWIDRLDLSGAVDDTGQNYAERFYKVFVDGVNPNSETPYFIDPTLAPHHVDTKNPEIDYYYIKVGDFAGSHKEVEAKILKAYLYTNAVDEAFTRDHPEVFWLVDSNLLLSVLNPETHLYEVHYVLSGVAAPNEEPFDIRQEDYRSISSLEAAIAERDQCVEFILKPILNESRYTQVRYLNHWLTHNNCYYCGDLSTLDCNKTFAPFRCLSALQGSTGMQGPVCEGYANAFKVLCDRLDIPCVLVNGLMKKDSHIWNYVQMEDHQWYAVDATLNDPLVEDCSEAISGYENERYLLVGSQSRPKDISFGRSHVVTNLSSHESNSTAFINGPALSPWRYWPDQQP